MKKKIECPICGGAATLTTKEREIQVGQRSAVVEDQFYLCADCHEETYLPGQMDATMRRASDAIRADLGLLSPGEIKAIRDRLGLKQAEFEKLLGVGPKTVVRWERGTVFQNQSTDSLLRALASVEGVATFLSRRAGVRLKTAGLEDKLRIFQSSSDDLVTEDRFVTTEERVYAVRVESFDLMRDVA